MEPMEELIETLEAESREAYDRGARARAGGYDGECAYQCGIGKGKKEAIELARAILAKHRTSV